MHSGNGHEKYIVFKASDLTRLLDKANSLVDSGWAYDGGDINKWIEEIKVQDAVVIRRQDVFSPPAFDTYANSILATAEALRVAQVPEEGLIGRLSGIADYFHTQAEMAWDTQRKLPD